MLKIRRKKIQKISNIKYCGKYLPSLLLLKQYMIEFFVPITLSYHNSLPSVLTVFKLTYKETLDTSLTSILFLFSVMNMILSYVRHRCKLQIHFSISSSLKLTVCFRIFNLPLHVVSGVCGFKLFPFLQSIGTLADLSGSGCVTSPTGMFYVFYDYKLFCKTVYFLLLVAIMPK